VKYTGPDPQGASVQPGESAVGVIPQFKFMMTDGNRIATTRHMKERSLTIPQIGLLASTRVALGVGIGLLISDRLRKDKRKTAGWALLGVGVLTTVPIVAGIFGKGPFAHRRIGLAA
jgi:hypothetical protein